MGIENDPGFWIPPEEKKKEQPGIPAQIPIPDQTPPPDFDPDKELPELDDHPKEDTHPNRDHSEPRRGAIIIGPDGEEEDDDDLFENKLKQW